MAALEIDFVLSDVHVSESHARDNINDNYCTHTHLSRFYFHVQTDLFLSQSESPSEGFISCLPCHQLNYSPAQIILREKKRKTAEATLSLDEDGDHILPRRNKKNKTFQPDLQFTSLNEEPFDAIVILLQKEVTSHSSESQTLNDFSETVYQFENADFTSVSKCDSTEPNGIQTENKDFVSSSDKNCTQDVTCAPVKKTKKDVHTDDKFQISIEHKMETILPEVGFQVWTGALLLCDYLIHNCNELEDKHVLDLGAGTGITSIVAAMFARCVVCTDYSLDLMELAERNWLRNKDYLPHRHCCEIYFKVLDWNWTCNYPPVEEKSSCSKYQINEDDLHLIEKATIIIAAEVVYDEDLTQAFFKTIYNLLSHTPPKSLIMALEKRIVFSSDRHQICSPAYEDFCENLADLTSIDEGPVHFSAVKISTEFPEYFHYKRHKNHELWKISSISM